MGISRDIVGWTANTEDRVASLYAPSTRWEKLPEWTCRLPDRFSIPVEDLRYQLDQVRSRFKIEPIIVDPETGKRRLTYRGIGLTSRSGSTDPIYEAAQFFSAKGEFVSSAKSMGYSGVSQAGSREAEFEKEFAYENEVAPDFVRQLRSLFKRWNLTKVRIMELHPEGRVAPHFDHPYYEQIRFHYVIETNADVFWEVEGHQFQVPNDGSLHWFDTGRIHSVYNFGETVRTVLSLHLCPKSALEDIPSADEFLRKLKTGDL